MSVFWLAEQLGKFVHEIEEVFTADMLAEYLAYFKLKNEEQKKEMDKAKKSQSTPKSGGRGRRRR